MNCLRLKPSQHGQTNSPMPPVRRCAAHWIVEERGLQSTSIIGVPTPVRGLSSLFLYGYCVGMYSPGRIPKHCERDAAYRVIKG